MSGIPERASVRRGALDRACQRARLQAGGRAGSRSGVAGHLGTMFGVQEHAEPAPRIIYLAALQVPGPVISGSNLAIRTARDPETMADLLWKEAHSEVADLRWRGATTQAHLVEGTIARDRMLAQLSGAFSFTAILLVCLGLYGLTAYEVSRRTAEIGVRLALGAQRSDVVRLFVGRSMMLVTSGVVAGVAGAAALARLVESLLFGVRSSDAATLVAAAAMLRTVG